MSDKAFFKTSTRSLNLNVTSLTPTQLAKLFKISIDDIMLQDNDGNVIMIEKNAFDPHLIANKTYTVMDNTKDDQQVSAMASMNLMPSAEQKMEIVEKITNDQVVKTLNDPAKDLSKLIPACACIEYLLVTVATSPDCSLVSSAVEEFHHLKNPNSMKVSVQQVAEDTIRLIQKNKIDLDFINLKTVFVSDQFKYILPAIWSKNGGIIDRTSRLMQDATTVCVKKSQDCADRCEHVINVIGELVKGLLGAKSDVESNDEKLRQTLAQLDEQVKLVQKKHDRKKDELKEQQDRFDEAWKEHQKQQKQAGSMAKSFKAAWVDIFSFGKAKARQGIDTAYNNATGNKKEEKDMLMQFREEFSKVEDQLIELKIDQEINKEKKHGLEGIIKSINEVIQRMKDLVDTAHNMQAYFQTINNLIAVTFQCNAQMFIEYAKQDNLVELEIKQMMEAVVKVYAISSIITNFAKIYSIAASSPNVQLRLTRGTSYLGLTHNEAKNKQNELDLENIEDETTELKYLIENELQNHAEETNRRISRFIDNCIQTANSIGN
uniref:Uncharacterized protein n=1 Tax=Panagrolaimus sp. PS1159 TaxID=55785 RepID=A0AC35GVB7_9BILA